MTQWPLSRYIWSSLACTHTQGSGEAKLSTTQTTLFWAMLGCAWAILISCSWTSRVMFTRILDAHLVINNWLCRWSRGFDDFPAGLQVQAKFTCTQTHQYIQYKYSRSLSCHGNTKNAQVVIDLQASYNKSVHQADIRMLLHCSLVPSLTNLERVVSIL